MATSVFDRLAHRRSVLSELGDMTALQNTDHLVRRLTAR